MQSTDGEVFIMSQGEVTVVHGRSTADHSHPVGQGDRIVASPGGHWVVAQEFEPSQSTPMARRLIPRAEPIPVTLAPGMAVAGIAGDEIVVSGGGVIYLLDPLTGSNRRVADGFVLATANDLLVRAVCVK